MIGMLLCWLGWHKWDLQIDDHTMDSMAYALMSGMNRFERGRAMKRVMDGLEKVPRVVRCRRCSKELRAGQLERSPLFDEEKDEGHL